MENKWIKILKQHLVKHPAYHSKDKLYKKEHKKDFFTPKNLRIVVRTKHKHYEFGGRIYSSLVSFYPNEIKVLYTTTKQYKIKLEKITGVDLFFD